MNSLPKDQSQMKDPSHTIREQELCHKETIRNGIS